MKKDYSFQNDNKIIIKDSFKTHQVTIENITHITCDGYVCACFLKGENKPLITCKLLKFYEIELTELGFIRANRNTLVNLKHIKCIEIHDSRILTLLNGQKIQISCRKIAKIKKILGG
ncbi:MAG: LytTR family DNA-binding domain-containing protein [Bacteroidales bacterium]|nr:LytTR family DNA-binding domain-containing protein [Bacteroidales bacterium]